MLVSSSTTRIEWRTCCGWHEFIEASCGQHAPACTGRQRDNRLLRGQSKARSGCCQVGVAAQHDSNRFGVLASNATEQFTRFLSSQARAQCRFPNSPRSIEPKFMSTSSVSSGGG